MSIRACQAPPARPPFARGASEHASGSGAADLQAGGGARNSVPPSARGRQGRGPGVGELPHWPPPADSRDATTADAAGPRSLTGAGRVLNRATARGRPRLVCGRTLRARAVAVARFEKLVGERRTRPPLPRPSSRSSAPPSVASRQVPLHCQVTAGQLLLACALTRNRAVTLEPLARAAGRSWPDPGGALGHFSGATATHASTSGCAPSRSVVSEDRRVTAVTPSSQRERERERHGLDARPRRRMRCTGADGDQRRPPRRRRAVCAPGRRR